MTRSPFTRFWRWLHVRMAAQQRRRTGDALVIANLRQRITAEEEAETARIAAKVAAAKRIAAAILAGHAAAKSGQVSALHLRVFWFKLNGMDCYYGAN